MMLQSHLDFHPIVVSNECFGLRGLGKVSNINV